MSTTMTSTRTTNPSTGALIKGGVAAAAVASAAAMVIPAVARRLAV